MLKGAQRRMVVIKTQDSRIFEEAYFVMRTESAATGEDMVSEANRIIEACVEKRHRRVGRLNSPVILPTAAFVCGCVLGCLLTVLVTIIV